jgi:hypothetical protein
MPKNRAGKNRVAVFLFIKANFDLLPGTVCSKIVKVKLLLWQSFRVYLSTMGAIPAANLRVNLFAVNFVYGSAAGSFIQYPDFGLHNRL